jgi:hypothetical protein
MDFLRRRRSSCIGPADEAATSHVESVLNHGGIQYVGEKDGNGNPISYQSVTGAPIEVESPLGHSVGSVTVLFFSINSMIGHGIYIVRECIN